ncbi:hypothetical protein EJB05_07442 [Eragrostis curvula]|uniref:BHLH domain-containing protein n=1 Tax=Eragrostis curvula TaxID=38414 RepID=A0A5J9WIE4_9POAL|nr:hypothetical protein EJB05_07442 [Eragrostis curvula]
MDQPNQWHPQQEEPVDELAYVYQQEEQPRMFTHPLPEQQQQRYYTSPPTAMAPPPNPFHPPSRSRSSSFPSFGGPSFGEVAVKTEPGQPSSSSPNILSFGGQPPRTLSFSAGDWPDGIEAVQQLPERRSRAHLNTQEHVVAERRRREKMQQQFVALATIVPDLTKHVPSGGVGLRPVVNMLMVTPPAGLEPGDGDSMPQRACLVSRAVLQSVSLRAERRRARVRRTWRVGGGVGRAVRVAKSSPALRQVQACETNEGLVFVRWFHFRVRRRPHPTDKISILGSTIEYVKQLEEKVNSLEEQSAPRTSEPTVFERKCRISSDNDASWPNGSTSSGAISGYMPTIEASIHGDTVLLKICCRERRGVLVMIFSEVENHGLSIINTSALPYTDSCLSVTITAKARPSCPLFFFEYRTRVFDNRGARKQLDRGSKTE